MEGAHPTVAHPCRDLMHWSNLELYCRPVIRMFVRKKGMGQEQGRWNQGVAGMGEEVLTGWDAVLEGR